MHTIEYDRRAGKLGLALVSGFQGGGLRYPGLLDLAWPRTQLKQQRSLRPLVVDICKPGSASGPS